MGCAQTKGVSITNDLSSYKEWGIGWGEGGEKKGRKIGKRMRKVRNAVI